MNAKEIWMLAESYALWLAERGRGTSFSTFVNEFCAGRPGDKGIPDAELNSVYDWVYEISPRLVWLREQINLAKSRGVDWVAVGKAGDLLADEVQRRRLLMFSPDSRNPAPMLIGGCFEGRYMSAGYQMVNVTHVAKCPQPPVPIGTETCKQQEQVQAAIAKARRATQ